ncbi:hypothetical protein AB0A94_15230 [Streptomyces sp. NPDC044984]|uniref:hypothetical protein n=1 Tax=Streptomyces sp. NPDC044984 TaxID=3154335 RepID=UPI0033E83CD9
MSPTSRPSPRPQQESERLRDAFGEVADGLMPSPVPLAAIERAGRARRRRRTAGMVIGCGLLLAPLAAVTVRAVLQEHSPLQRNEVAAHPTPPDTPDVAGSVRVVAPGERVQAGAGVELWLTEEGEHWSTPEMDHQFRSVADRDVGHRRLTVGLMTETVGDRCFLSGLYTGTVDVGRVVVDTGDGKVTASVVRLPGTPDWGVWYADVPLHEDLTVNGVTLYSTRGKDIASMAPSRP